MIARKAPSQPWTDWGQDEAPDRWWFLWWLLCTVLALALVVGGVTALVVLWPHLVAMVDRLGR